MDFAPPNVGLPAIAPDEIPGAALPAIALCGPVNEGYPGPGKGASNGLPPDNPDEGMAPSVPFARAGFEGILEGGAAPIALADSRPDGPGYVVGLRRAERMAPVDRLLVVVDVCKG